MLEEIRALYAYGAWANARVLDSAEQLDPERLTTDVDGFGAIRDTLVHTASAQWTWVERWHGNSPVQLWDPAEFPDVESLRTRWALVEDATSAYLATLDEPELARVVGYVNFQGEAWSYPLWQQLLHQANHATQHRSEAAQLLTRFGCSPGSLDFLVFFDEQGPH
ncbi:MAG: DinB family protein [Chloroflexi bacterium]|nr:DinB family protein [Chloroflexota bacterium]